MVEHLTPDLTIDAIVFDFDGTLAELQLDFAEMKRRLAELAVPWMGYRPQPGALPALEWLAALAREAQSGNGQGAADLIQAGHALIRGMELEAARRGRLFPFTRPLLRGLKRQGLALAIITRNCRAAVNLVFPDWAEYCDSLLSRDQVERVKPDPDHLLTALSGLGCSPRHCLMVGDHWLDIETGRRAGTWTAGVASGKLSAGDLAQAAPNWLATDCAELIAILNGQARLRVKPPSQPAAF